MTQIIGFFATTSDPSSPSHKNALGSLTRLAQQANKQVLASKLGELSLYLIGSNLPTVENPSNQRISFVLTPNSKLPFEWDRYLRVEITTSHIQIENDYSATIPVFYSTTNTLSLSNIAGCVEKDVSAGISDLFPEAIYGFIRFSHLIWDETAFTKIKSLPPDIIANFALATSHVSIESKQCLKADASRLNHSDAMVADELYELNKRLVMRTLGDAETIVLPLSAGYDSRMIFSVLAKDKSTKKRLRCFTYGDPGCVEVEAARSLCKHEGVSWEQVTLPCEFLEPGYQNSIHDIFGASLHMHGMYQLEFFDVISKRIPNLDGAVLTSGFMTGVPAGQHNRMLNIHSADQNLIQAMGAFSQSKLWSEEQLNHMPLFNTFECRSFAERQFRKAFDAAPGQIHHKSIVFDLWTRQRNFISYYPRTLEWRIPTISPHMNAEYANFFLSLGPRHLDDRVAVQLMFAKHYPSHASIVSNSHGIKPIRSGLDSIMFALSKKTRFFGINKMLLPKKFWATGLSLDMPAVQKTGRQSLYPLFSDEPLLQEFFQLISKSGEVQLLATLATQGDSKAYEMLLSIQSIALSILKSTND